MENKKLLKFLLKDIAEIEELFEEKGGSGFDSMEIEFLQSRFAGARKIIHLLAEKENEQPVKTQEKIVEEVTVPKAKEVVAEVLTAETEEEPVKESMPENQPAVAREEETLSEVPEEEPVIETKESPEASEPEFEEIEAETPAEVVAEKQEMELDEQEEEEAETGKTLGDSFQKEKSLNDLLTNGIANLESKLSNSPVASIQAAIGINDRYQYIRELFDGSADRFAQAVTELDSMGNIQEAVAYLQQNYKWKKNETSLKFVGLVKRRFPNG